MEFSAEEFVEKLLTEASKIPCDENLEEFNENNLPAFYNESKFSRGQKFFEDNIFALYFNKLLGLMVTLASPSVLNILRNTNMSDSIYNAYRRYLATLFHMNIWYRSELTPESRSMKSIRRVKMMHNAASNGSKSSGMPPITQKDMVLTQFGFMGFAVARTELIGVHNISEDEIGSLIHFWRVVGSIMGIQDRFNLCRESTEETIQICNALIEKILNPSFVEKEPVFLRMTSYLINGMWHMMPILHYKVFMSYLAMLLESQNDKLHVQYFELNIFERMFFKLMTFIVWSLRYSAVRIYLNMQLNMSLWLMHNFPFLAFYSFGYRKAYVEIKS